MTDVGDLELDRVSVDGSRAGMLKSLLVELRVASALESVVGCSLLEVGVRGLGVGRRFYLKKIDREKGGRRSGQLLLESSQGEGKERTAGRRQEGERTHGTQTAPQHHQQKQRSSARSQGFP
jgi:hypothetical protein